MPGLAGLSGGKKTLVIGGIGLGGGLLAYSLWKQKKAAAAAAAAPAATATDPSIDPATEVPWADESTGMDTSGFGDYGNYTYGPDNGLGGYDASGGGYYNAGLPGAYPQTAVTNAQWVQAAVSALTEQGWNGQQVQTALGAYTTGAPVTGSNLSIVQAAIGAEGYPPVNGPNGFPPGINNGNGSGGSGTGTGGGTTTTLTAPGLSVTGGSGAADFGWSAIPGAQGYSLSITGAKSLTQTVQGNHAEHVILPKGKYRARVQALPGGPWSMYKSFTVK